MISWEGYLSITKSPNRDSQFSVPIIVSELTHVLLQPLVTIRTTALERNQHMKTENATP